MFDATQRRKERMRAVARSAGTADDVGDAGPAPQADQPERHPPAPRSTEPSPQRPAAVPGKIVPAPPRAEPVPSTALSTTSAAVKSNGQSLGDLSAFLVNFVVEQTGYPPEMVELDADLEADLGIDSIKKAQLFGELAEHFEISSVGDLSLEDFPTLRHVLQFLEHAPRKQKSQVTAPQF